MPEKNGDTEDTSLSPLSGTGDAYSMIRRETDIVSEKEARSSDKQECVEEYRQAIDTAAMFFGRQKVEDGVRHMEEAAVAAQFLEQRFGYIGMINHVRRQLIEFLISVAEWQMVHAIGNVGRLESRAKMARSALGNMQSARVLLLSYGWSEENQKDLMEAINVIGERVYHILHEND